MQLFLDHPVKTEEARGAFEELSECTYLRKLLGELGQHEIMTCDCHEQWDQHEQANRACGEDSGCINRATLVECLDEHCALLCGRQCANQRFQRRQYAAVAVIEAGRKGYGLRAEADIAAHSFIYEYIGEVIDEATFRRRMRAYDERGLRHFYFMMLQRNLFIDATERGSLARFCNHSCLPNSYVDKWVVGTKLRMGIFSKRAIVRGEEITFDYNVDRYGAQLQPCYCGEPNCLGYMGGKTQTDLALLLPEGISDALGVTPAVERAWLRDNKHLRAKQQRDDAVVNERFVALLAVAPLALDLDVLKVMGALLKLQDAYVVSKLVERLWRTTDAALNTHAIRMHGYKTMLQLAAAADPPLLVMLLEILLRWPKVTKNKILLLQIEAVVRLIEQTTGDARVRELCALLLAEWGALQMAYRIPKHAGGAAAGYARRDDDTAGSGDDANGGATDTDARADAAADADPLPDGWESTLDDASGQTYYFNRELGLSRWDRPTHPVPEDARRPPAAAAAYGSDALTPNTPLAKPNMDEVIAKREEERLQRERERQFRELKARDRRLQELITASQREAEAKRELEAKARRDALEEKERKRRKKHPKPPAPPLWTRLFAKTVPNMIKKHEPEIGHDNVKNCARDIVKLLSDKEAAKLLPVPAELDRHKTKKVHDFCRGYMDKFLAKYRHKHHAKS
jgi:SET domain-containing protein